jgi:hypothetical protein
MRLIELLGLVVATLVLLAILVPMPCIPPSCGPPDAAPPDGWEMALIYLAQPPSWLILGLWVVAGVSWLRRRKR